MSYNPKFTIIIPTYNEEEDIEDTIKLLLQLQYDNFDILIIDDSSKKLKVAKKEGFLTYLFKNEKEFNKYLSKIMQQ